MSSKSIFSLESPYEPSGDQPAAISKLVQGLADGVTSQSVLGVTGSGKSILRNTKVLFNSNGRFYHTKIGLIDELFSPLPDECEVTQYLPIEKDFKTLAIDTKTGDVSLGNVTEVSRHRYQGDLYRVTTNDGRINTFTDSHNVFVVRNGSLMLLRSDELQLGDRVPAPCSIPQPDHPIECINVAEWVNDPRMNFYPDEQSALLFSGHVTKKHGCISLCEYKNLSNKNDLSGALGFVNKQAQLPSKIPLTSEVLKFLGLFIAEGCIQQRCIKISTGDVSLLDDVHSFAAQVSLIVKSTSSKFDYVIQGKTISKLMESLCGKGAHNKHLPAFWPQLDDTQLGVLLSGVFAGDGCMEKKEITLSSVSYELVSDIQLALSRFGVLARIRNKKVKYKDEWRQSFILSVTGQRNCKLFQQYVGFGLGRKDILLEKLCHQSTTANTNVDVMTLPLDLFTDTMKQYGVLHRDLSKVIGVERPLIGMYLANKRNPERSKAKRMAQYLAAVSRDHQDNVRAQQLEDYAALANVPWFPIKNIEKEYTDTVVYDLSVPDVQTFLANGYFVHNTFTAAHVIAQSQRPAIVLAPNKTLAAQLYSEFKSFFPHNAVEYFVSYYDYYQPEAYIPSTDTFVDKDAQINEQIEQMRLSATKSLMERRDVIVVASVSSIYGLGDPSEFFSMSMHFKKGEKLFQRDLLRRLAELQYTRNDMELKRSTFRARGDIIDIFPADHEKWAVRVELFDDEVEKISLIDPLTGQAGKELLGYTLYPKSHYVTTRQRTLQAIETIKVELVERLAVLRSENKLLEAQRLEERTRYDLEMMAEVGYCNGNENYSPHLTQQKPGTPPPTLFSYLPKDAIMIVDESHVTVPQIGGMYKADRSRKTTLVDFGFRLPSAMDNRPMSFEEWEKVIPQAIYVSATPGQYEKDNVAQENVAELVVRPTGLLDPIVEVRPQSTQVDDLLGEIKIRVKKGERVLATTLTKKSSEHLSDYLAENGIKVRYLHSEIDTLERMEILRDLRLGTFDVLVGINLLREGLDLPEVSLVAILDADKEGFLRSTRSLIQTIGRAARNQNGRAILYADKVTRSMQETMDEMDRRREKQVAYNEEHGITPTTIKRRVADLMDDQPKLDGDAPKKKGKKDVTNIDDESLWFAPEDKLNKILATMEKTMLEHAKNLEFEKAGELRDRIQRIKEKRILVQ